MALRFTIIHSDWIPRGSGKQVGQGRGAGTPRQTGRGHEAAPAPSAVA